MIATVTPAKGAADTDEQRARIEQHAGAKFDWGGNGDNRRHTKQDTTNDVANTGFVFQLLPGQGDHVEHPQKEPRSLGKFRY